MRINTSDLTLKRNYLQKYQFLIKEYELVKKRQHPRFRFVKDFWWGIHLPKHHVITRFMRVISVLQGEITRIRSAHRVMTKLNSSTNPQINSNKSF